MLAVYPDTTSLYRAEVMAIPPGLQAGARVRRPPLECPARTDGPQSVASGKKEAQYKLKFEDDDDQVKSVDAALVVECPPAQ